MPSLLYPVFPLPEMCDKKSPPRKERPIFVSRTPQPDDRGMKRKLLSPPAYTPPSDDDNKVTPNKRKRGILSVEGSPQPLTTPKTPGSASRPPPLSERQQLAMIMRMNDGASQGAPITEQADGAVMTPLSPSAVLPATKKTPIDKKVNKRNERGEFPIHIAAIRGDLKLVKKLIRADVDVNVSDWAGWTPLHEACNRGWLSVSKQLLKAGANVNVQGLENDTPLHDASINGHKKLVELLLKHGANPVQYNSNGKTPLDIASSPDIVKLLKREMITTSSDSSSMDDLRSPMSPDSIISKDDEHSLDSEDLPRSRTGSSSSSSCNNRPLTRPQSPDNKLASPRLCLKFQRELSGQAGHATKDSKIPQYKSSYSVKSLSMDSDDSSSPFDNFGSCADSDPCKGVENLPGLKLTGGEVLNCMQPGSTVIQPNRTSPCAMELHTCDGSSHTNSASDRVKQLDFSVVDSTTNSSAKSRLRPLESEPFTHHVGWSDMRDEKADYELPDLEPDLTVTSIPISEPHSRLKETHDIHSFPRGSTNNTGEGQISNNGLHSAAVSSSTGVLSRNFVESTVNGSDVTNSDSNFHSVTNKRFKPTLTENMNNVSSSSVSESRSVTNLKWELRSSASPKSENGSVHSKQSDTVLSDVSPSEAAESVSDKVDLHEDSRSSSPKVPPLKIVMPTKSTATSSTTESETVKLVASKAPGLPYVINPTTQDNVVSGMAEVDPTQEESVEDKCVSLGGSQISSSVSQSSAVGSTPGLSSTVESDKDEKRANNDAASDMDISGDIRNSELLNKDESPSETDSRKDEPLQRVLRSAARSTPTKPDGKQQQKPDKESNVDSPSDTDGNSVTVATTNKSSKTEEEVYQDIQAKKRKIRPKSDATTVPANETPIPSPITTGLERVPNPYELFLSLRKQVAYRRRNIVAVCPKIPQGYKDYLMTTCNYVLEGNTTSTLSVPTLSAPNSVKDPMSNMFVDQEKIRYNLRLQHLVEREKLILSIEQEMLREHCRAARAMVNQGIPLSVCTILRDQEIYNSQDLDQEKEDKRHRSRFNGRQFISWLQDVGDKYQKIKESLILRQKQEADSLYAIQKLEWGWKLQETGECDRNATPDIDDLHVPLVYVQDNFDLLPT